MGMIADRLRQQLTEMRERHAETDRELAEAREDVYRSLDALSRSWEALAEDS